ncbi:type II secretion system protein GspH [Pseudomonas agarici]|uniref:Type II secretion system protein H n=1 Tax=Pseudomonas agarici TaxID=46677 RepID=A0A0X1T1Z6_PSEAA|nr:GspH/FimT family pseudopilin [Pseudomonas agarici]AMB86064.1 type II secretion system protein GspH [Pseudomonas agarici]NWB92257.1 GspH/FimT family pseudopilin [Pseudomonas agarici]NWC07503.1 GspH/FimT family pseudopilin [Pseudomonas agarici]SEK42236.1 type II secretion system protein H (GspH) [Pseudomonas agarici]
MADLGATRGFTLLEMLVVILIISIGTSLLAHSVTGGLDNARERQAKRELSLALRSVRSQAVLSGQPTTLHFDLRRDSYRIGHQAEHFLPEGMHLRLTTAVDLSSSRDGAVEFYPDGGSSGGNVYLERGPNSWRVDIAWLTGKVSWQDGAQP